MAMRYRPDIVNHVSLIVKATESHFLLGDGEDFVTGGSGGQDRGALFSVGLNKLFGNVYLGKSP